MFEYRRFTSMYLALLLLSLVTSMPKTLQCGMAVNRQRSISLLSAVCVQDMWLYHLLLEKMPRKKNIKWRKEWEKNCTMMVDARAIFDDVRGYVANVSWNCFYVPFFYAIIYLITSEFMVSLYYNQ